jgi:molybdopterin-guanine dinucleotide biosynthesis protein A
VTDLSLPSPSAPLGAILAGGASTRFGEPKALATVGGRRIVDRVREALAEAVERVVMIANEPEMFAYLGIEARPDRVRGAGPLAGIETALRWAREERRSGALCVACDLPFISPALLREIVRRAEWTERQAVLPQSAGRTPYEPLCAWYSVDLLPVIEHALEAGTRSVHAVLDGACTEIIPLDVVHRFGEPDILFLNVNTRDDLERARHAADRTDALA